MVQSRRKGYVCSALAITFNQWTAASIIGLIFAIAAVVTVHADRRDQVIAAAAARTLPPTSKLCWCFKVGEPSLTARTLTVYALLVIAMFRAGAVRHTHLQCLSVPVS